MRKAELPALTGIRFYAALAVYLSHITTIPGMDALGGDKLLFNVGVVGVSVFFVLSGFILTYNYADHFESGVSAKQYKHFIWDRLTKIYPVHFAVLLVMIPLQIYSPNLPLDWRAVPFHFFLLQCFWPYSHPAFYTYLNVPSWSISCEWFFYLFAPITIFMAYGQLRRWLIFIILLLYAAGLGLVLSYNPSEYNRLVLVSWFAPSRFIEFATGIFLARAFIKMRLENPVVLSAIAQISGLLLLVVGAFYRKYSPWPLHGGLLYLPGSALLIFGLALGRGFFVSHLSSPGLKRLGLASFSFYLIHAPVIRITKGVCLKLHWAVNSWTAYWLVAAVMFVLIQFSAFLVYHGYEMPIQQRLRGVFRTDGRKETSKLVKSSTPDFA